MKDKSANSARKGYMRISDAASDQLYVQIIQKVGVEKRYQDPNYSAKKLAEELHVNPRYISAALALHTGDNYNALVNGYRLRDACRMLRSPRYLQYTVEEIGIMCGFASRQAFYLAFHREHKMTPRKYRFGKEE